MNRERIFLIGPRGSGKSTVAPLLAERLGWYWIDLDTEIATKAGRDIAGIIGSDGEEEFRRLESDSLREACRNPRQVIATGGGIVIQAEHRELLKQSGFVVLLDADARVLWERIQSDEQSARTRPNLLRGGLEEVETLKREREPWYAECQQLRLDTGLLTPVEVVQSIVAFLNSA